MPSTPGPWTAMYWDERVSEQPHWSVECNLPDVLTVVLVGPHSGYGSLAEDEANAALIAAAPKMLEALISAHERLFENDLCLCGEKDIPMCDIEAIIESVGGK